VTVISEGAGEGCYNLATLRIPSTVTRLAPRAFSCCVSLVELVIPVGVREIGEQSFAACSIWQRVTVLASELTIGDEANSACTSLTDLAFIHLDEYTIGSYAFRSCGFTKFFVPEGVTMIGVGAFAYCSLPVQIQLPRLSEIADSTFCGCSSLVRVRIPSGTQSIGPYAFDGCGELVSVTFPRDIGIRWDRIAWIGWFAFRGCVGLRELVLPPGISYIGNGAFENCKGLTKLILPDQLESVGETAFRDCIGLEELEIPRRVRHIGRLALSGCSNLSRLTIPADAAWGDDVLRRVANVKVLTLSGRETTIPIYKMLLDCLACDARVIGKGFCGQRLGNFTIAAA
jgi:hypothetical protein